MAWCAFRARGTHSTGGDASGGHGRHGLIPGSPSIEWQADTQAIPKHVQVVQILPALDTGGAKKMVVHLASELMKTGIQTGVVSFYDVRGSQIDRALRADGIPVWSLGKRRGLDLAMIARLRRLIV